MTESWYLVNYEDDGNLRVLSEDEIRPIFEDNDDEEEIEVDDIVSAIWAPNGQYYDARVLKIGGEFHFFGQVSYQQRAPTAIYIFQNFNFAIRID